MRYWRVGSTLSSVNSGILTTSVLISVICLSYGLARSIRWSNWNDALESEFIKHAITRALEHYCETKYFRLQDKPHDRCLVEYFDCITRSIHSSTFRHPRLINHETKGHRIEQEQNGRIYKLQFTGTTRFPLCLMCVYIIISYSLICYFR